jgi:hypothetical protein
MTIHLVPEINMPKLHNYAVIVHREEKTTSSAKIHFAKFISTGPRSKNKFTFKVLPHENAMATFSLHSTQRIKSKNTTLSQKSIHFLTVCM